MFFMSWESVTPAQKKHGYDQGTADKGHNALRSADGSLPALRYRRSGRPKDKLIETISASLKSDRVTDSPIFRMLPALPEADPSKVQAVPVDFREEVDRARAAKSKGWLRLLSGEVRNRRFQWGVQLVATAQWDLKDWEGARESWETIRGTHPDDIDANLALANIYERLYREMEEPRPEYMEASDDAIKRVLDSKEASREQRVEGLTLGGRNQKTRWRLHFNDLKTTEECRARKNNNMRCSG